MSSRCSKRQRTSGDVLDMSNYMNWTASKLRNELEKVNILTSLSFGVSTLRKLYNKLNVSHGIPENSSVVSEAFGNTVNTIVDTGNHSASLPENYFQPNVQ